MTARLGFSSFLSPPSAIRFQNRFQKTFANLLQEMAGVFRSNHNAKVFGAEKRENPGAPLGLSAGRYGEMIRRCLKSARSARKNLFF
jgi:hypothetical protein